MASDAIDLGEKHVIGGVIRFDLLTLPRQPKAGRGWTITTCVRPPQLSPFEYAVDTHLVNNQTATSNWFVRTYELGNSWTHILISIISGCNIVFFLQ